jgi:peroxiredoxin
MNIGDKLIPFDLEGVDGLTHSSADYTDHKALAVIFSCNHCPYARAWEERLVQIQADYAAHGVQLVAVSANDAEKYPQDSLPAMKARAAEKGFNFPYLYDETQALARAYDAGRTPEVFLFDDQRKLRYHGAIDDNYDDPTAVQQPYLRDALDSILAGREPAISETPPVGCTIKWK